MSLIKKITLVQIFFFPPQIETFRVISAEIKLFQHDMKVSGEKKKGK